MKNNTPTPLPIIALKTDVFFPNLTARFPIGRQLSINALAQAKTEGHNLVLVVSQKENSIDSSDANPSDLFEYGVLSQVTQVRDFVDSRDSSQRFNVELVAITRVKIKNAVKKEDGTPFGYLAGEYDSVPEVVVLNEDVPEISEFKQLAVNYTKAFGEKDKDISFALLKMIKEGILDLTTIANSLAMGLSLLGVRERQSLLAMDTIKERILVLNKILGEAISQKNQKDKESLINNRRKHSEEIQEIMRQKQEALENSPHKDLLIKKSQTKLPPEIDKVVEEEIRKLNQISPNSSEYNIVRNYVDSILSLPWLKSSKDILDVVEARKILDEDHYGLEKVKRRILEFISVAKFKNSLRGSIICLVGPPGVGKTSLGKSIARAVNRKFIRISLGGTKDEAEIRGHRRTYVGAMPGKLLQGMKKAGVNNPVILLDEIDKMTANHQGDPSAAMLEVLDPEQNMGFLDHYLDLPFDLSNTLFIATANVLEDIPAPLRDRMEIIYVGAYTSSEKSHIAQNYLVPKQIKEHGLTDKEILFEKLAVQKIIADYTREAGVRELQRMVAAVCRSVAQEILEKNSILVEVTTEKVRQYLGMERYRHENSLPDNEIGVVTGMAWTPVGGDVLFVEVNKMPGNGRLILTGSLGNVMKESAQIAMSYIRANSEKLKLTHHNFDKFDIHIHFPSGAIPKDGPSAGITLATAMVSLLTEKMVNSKISMTGEISLRGKVLPVGGIKEKVIGAHRAGIKEIILPKSNISSIEDIPDEVKDDLKFHLVEDISQVLDIALIKESPVTPTVSSDIN